MIEAAASGALAALISTVGAVYASRAARNSKPVSNGFAAGVNTKLDALTAHLEDVHKDVREVRSSLIAHLQDHP
mgnify:CR=1 FL=1